MRILANLVRGKRVEEALRLLKHTPKRSGIVLHKLLVSALANAEHAGIGDVDNFVVRACCIDNGPIEKRWLARAMGRANRIQRRTSHVTIVVAAAA
jgi:large subunit ribosomal protein L22